jgi:hypothetical protein
MSGREHDPLIQIAAAVSDGTPVDWEQEKTHRPSLRAALEHLSVLERIRDLHRRPVNALTGSPAASATDDTRTAGRDPAAPAQPLFTWGTLRVLEKVGEGAWGEVFRAFDPSLETEVALKLLKENVSAEASAVENFISEARRLARVRHPNVLVVHGADRHGDRVGIWVELLRGESLEKHIRRAGSMSAQEATLIGLDLCRALSAVHTAGLVHRDVKASNVMREEGGRTVLMDFGSVAELPRPGAMDATRHIHGTPSSMAPEQLRGEIAGAATDVYGLGALLYHLVSGRHPVEAQTLAELVRRHERREYVPLRDRRADLPLEFVRVVERATAHDPASRYQSAGALEQALAGTLVGEKASWPEWLVSHWGVAAAAAALLAAAIGLGAWLKTRPEPTPPPPAQAVALSAFVRLQRAVGSTEEPVPPGGTVQPGDQLSMQVRGDERMHVYVLDTDREGEVYVLFPIPGAEPANPIEAHRTYRLPGTLADSSLLWDVTSAGGQETIVAIGARTPLPEIDSVLAKLPRVGRGRPVRISPDAIPRLRGIGGLSVGPPEPTPAARRWVEEMLRHLQERRAARGDVWLWQTQLENPAPKR